MALIDKASLLMVPSTYEAGKLYNVLPSGNRAPDNKGGAGYDQTRADFDFDRGSNAAASRINSSGLIEKYRENVLLQSNNFGTTWLTANTSLTSGQSGYDGTNNAWLLEVTATGSYRRVYQSGINLDVNTFSIYAKANTSNFLFLLNNKSSTDAVAWFDLSNGSIGGVNAAIDTKIESVGNGWYRCSVTSIFADNQYFVSVADGSADINGTIGTSLYIQSAQLESGLAATDVLTSGATTAKAGVLIDLPRINFDANGENGALLLEPSRQQLLQYSEYFGGWTLSNSTITSNATTSPEGVNNASLYTSTNVTNYVRNIITASNATYTLSVFVKRVSTDEFRMNFSDGVTGEIRYVFNLADETSTLTKSGGTISGYSADFENYGNGWYRLHITATTNAGTAITAYFETDNETGSFYAYGAQLEAGSYATSYIPTYGVSQTRAQDNCFGAGDGSTFNDSEGVLFIEAATLSELDITARYFQLSDGTITANGITFRYYTTTNYFQALYYTGGAYQAVLSVFLSDSSQFNKIAYKYKANDFALWVNGVKIGTDTSGNTGAVLSNLNFNNNGYDGFEGKTKQLLYFNEALSDSELATLTTL